MRRAVMICNMVMIILVLIKILFYETLGWEEKMALNADDDEVRQEGEELEGIPFGFLVFIALVQIACYGVGFYGALIFHEIMVLVGLVCHSLMVVWHLLTFSDFITFIIQISLSVGFAYPHAFLYKEIKEQIMTPENYPNEVQSCCCVQRY